jgi:hypothetical protein
MIAQLFEARAWAIGVTLFVFLVTYDAPSRTWDDDG